MILCLYAYAYDDPYVAGLTSFLCFAFCFTLTLMISCEPGLKLFSSDAFFFLVRLRTCAQYTPINELTCSEHSVHVCTDLFHKWRLLHENEARMLLSQSILLSNYQIDMISFFAFSLLSIRVSF